MTIERLKWAAVISFIVSLGGLLIGGMFANRETPPYPSRVMGPDGTTLFTKSDIIAGQDVYQRYGLMDHGSVWGHGSQRGMEFSVVTLHLMGETVQAHVARDSFGRPLAELTGEDRDVVDIRTRRDLKTNRFDATTNVLTLSDGQVEALGKAASSFWNFLGAGVFGFLINLPLVNYFEHGTYLTVNHGHGALFGVYGTLSISLLLFSWRGLVQRDKWNDRLLAVSFWGLNGGLLAMTLLTLFPVGIAQAWTSYAEGLWVAREVSFFERPIVATLSQLRIIPDTVIIVFGILPLVYFLFKTFPHLKAAEIPEGASV